MEHSLFACLFILWFTGIVNAQSPAPGYKLVWSDEFSNDGAPDSAKWRYENGFVHNEEAQWYQPENAVCKGDSLVITGKKENRPNPNYIAGSGNCKTNRPDINYTSASVVMRKEHAFQYGRLEVRAKIDAQNGLWPAIWTLGIEGQWPSNGEVDMMEYYGNKIIANFAIAGKVPFRAIWDGAASPIDSFGVAGWANNFHTLTLEWNENTMRILIDGQLMNATDLAKSINKSDGRNPFRQPHYLLLNLAMGRQPRREPLGNAIVVEVLC